MTTQVIDHNSTPNGTPRASLQRGVLPVLFVAAFCAVILFASIGAKPALQVGGGVMAAIALVALVLARTSFATLPRLPLIICGGIVAVVAASTVWAIVPDAAIKATWKLPLIFIAGVAMITYAKTVTPRDIPLFKFMPLIFLVALMVVLFSQVFDFPLQQWWSGDESAPESVLNKGMGALSLLTPALLMPLLYKGKRQKALCVLALGALFLVIMGSEAQTSLLVFFLMIIAFVVPLRIRAVWGTLYVLIAAGIIGAPFLVHYLYTNTAAEMMQSPLMQKASAPQRLELWDSVAKKAMESPVIGYGFDSTRYVDHFDSPAIYYPYTTFMHPHNMALQFWMEYGAIGAVLGAAAVLAVLRRIQTTPTPRVQRLYFMTFTSTLAVSLIAWGMWETWWIVLIFVLIAANVMAGKQLSDKQP